jgi:hypothetical protein
LQHVFERAARRRKVLAPDIRPEHSVSADLEEQDGSDVRRDQVDGIGVTTWEQMAEWLKLLDRVKAAPTAKKASV